MLILVCPQSVGQEGIQCSIYVPGWIYLCITNSYFTSSLYAGYIIVVEYKLCVCFRPVSFQVAMYISMNVLSQVMKFPLGKFWTKLCHFITGKCQHRRNLIMHTAWVSRTTFVLQTGVTHFEGKIYLHPWVHIQGEICSVILWNHKLHCVVILLYVCVNVIHVRLTVDTLFTLSIITHGYSIDDG